MSVNSFLLVVFIRVELSRQTKITMRPPENVTAFLTRCQQMISFNQSGRLWKKLMSVLP